MNTIAYIYRDTHHMSLLQRTNWAVVYAHGAWRLRWGCCAPQLGGGFGREHVRLALEQLGLHVQRQLAPRGAPQRILDDLVLLRRQRCNEAAPARGQ
jgi:hypothetical protein